MRRLILGSRGSRLALVQAELVRRAILAAAAAVDVEIEVVRTRGDRDETTSVARMERVGVFTKELEDALLDGRVDLAVHSCKDLPTTLETGLRIGAVPPRASASDVLVTPDGRSWRDLPDRARIGTGSPRRTAQLTQLRPDVGCVPLRGNVPTRLARYRDLGLDGVILARAGLERLGSNVLWYEFEPDEMLPAPGQGALAVEALVARVDLDGMLRAIDDVRSRSEVEAERAFLAELGGGCSVAAGALALSAPDGLWLRGALASGEGALVRAEERGDDPAVLGRRLAARIRAGGGR